MCSYENASNIKLSASQIISNMICMNYDHKKKFGLLKFHSGYGKFYLNSPMGYCRKIINAQTGSNKSKQPTNVVLDCPSRADQDVDGPHGGPQLPVQADVDLLEPPRVHHLH